MKKYRMNKYRDSAISDDDDDDDEVVSKALKPNIRTLWSDSMDRSVSPKPLKFGPRPKQKRDESELELSYASKSTVY